MTVISWQRRRVRCVDHVMGWKGRIKLGHERGVWYCIVAANLYRRGSKTGSRGEGVGMHLSLELTFSKCRFGLLGICHYDGRLLPRSGNSCVRWAVSRQTSANAFKSALKPTSPAWELVPQSIWGRTRSTDQAGRRSHKQACVSFEQNRLRDIRESRKLTHQQVSPALIVNGHALRFQTGPARDRATWSKSIADEMYSVVTTGKYCKEGPRNKLKWFIGLNHSVTWFQLIEIRFRFWGFFFCHVLLCSVWIYLHGWSFRRLIGWSVYDRINTAGQVISRLSGS